MSDNPSGFTKIIVNGREVGPEQVPELLKKFVVDANQDGIPDFLETFLKNPFFKMVAGKSIENFQAQLKNLTPDQQKKIAALMEKLGEPSSAPASSYKTPTNANTPVIDYKALGIPNPEQKRSSLGWLSVLIVLGLIGAAAWMLLRH